MGMPFCAHSLWQQAFWPRAVPCPLAIYPRPPPPHPPHTQSWPAPRTPPLSPHTQPALLLSTLQGKRVGDVVNRIHVAMPRARDGLARPPVIPPGVAEARARRDAGEKRKKEKDLQARRKNR